MNVSLQAKSFVFVLVVAACSLAGCNSQYPGGSVIQPEMLGSKTDEINRLQEENAELAKLIVYTHEFEINLQPKRLADKSYDTFEYSPEIRPHGMRLTPAGEDHVKQIAKFLSGHQYLGTHHNVVVERSETSKRWATEHQYPVHRNRELDEMRRMVVVTALVSLGIPEAEEFVVIAPAYPTGMSAVEASQAYENTRDSGRDVRR